MMIILPTESSICDQLHLMDFFCLLLPLFSSLSNFHFFREAAVAVRILAAKKHTQKGRQITQSHFNAEWQRRKVYIELNGKLEALET